MGGGKQTPRQKMIGMMYLVLTALLALNVSTTVLKSFLIVNESIEATNRNFESKVASLYAMFDRALAENKEKVQPNFDKALEARRLTAEFREYVQRAKGEMIQEVVDKKMPLQDAIDYDPRDIQRQDNYDTPSMIFIEQGKGKELHNIIIDYEAAMLALLPDDNSRARIQSAFNIVGPFYDAGKTEVSWEVANFNKTIIVAAITILNKLENDAMNLEYDVVTELFNLVSAADLKFDNVVARIVPKSTFVALGENFEADVFLVAFDSKTRVTANVNGQIIHSKDGVVPFTQQTSKEGLFSVQGYIRLPVGGGHTDYPFKTEYIVAAPSATVSADKMNVFYIGVDNPITTAVSGVDPTNISAEIHGAGGTLTKDPSVSGGYIARVNTRGEAIVTLSVRSGGTVKPVGSFKYRVKSVPDPIALINGFDDDQKSADRNVLERAGGLQTKMPDFDFDLPGIRIVSFTMSTGVGSDIIPFRSTNNRFTDQMVTQIKNARKGQRFYFDDIMCQMPTGARELRPFIITIK
jgi:gliding motility-associated protein GldM